MLELMLNAECPRCGENKVEIYERRGSEILKCSSCRYKPSAREVREWRLRTLFIFASFTQQENCWNSKIYQQTRWKHENSRNKPSSIHQQQKTVGNLEREGHFLFEAVLQNQRQKTDIQRAEAVYDGYNARHIIPGKYSATVDTRSCWRR